MTLTLKNVPQRITDALELKARQEGRRVDEIVIEALTRDLGLDKGQETKLIPRNNLSRFRGTWVEDPEFDKAMEYFEQIDEELWK